MKLRSRSSRATGPKMRVPRGLFCGVDQHRGVLVEADVGAVLAAVGLLGPHDDGGDDLALLDRALRVGGLDGRGDRVADAGVATARAARGRGSRGSHGRRSCRRRAGVSRSGSCYLALSTTPTRRQRLERDSGRALAHDDGVADVGVVGLVVGVQRLRGAHDLLVAAVAPGDVDPHGDRLVGLVGDDDRPGAPSAGRRRARAAGVAVRLWASALCLSRTFVRRARRSLAAAARLRSRSASRSSSVRGPESPRLAALAARARWRRSLGASCTSGSAAGTSAAA